MTEAVEPIRDAPEPVTHGLVTHEPVVAERSSELLPAIPVGEPLPVQWDEEWDDELEDSERVSVPPLETVGTMSRRASLALFGHA
jgi:hypothetical protein